MNYYHDWWENARKQTGILTKPEERKFLLKKVQELEEVNSELKAGLENHKALELEKTLLESDLEALRTSLDFSNLNLWERENSELKEELTNLQTFSQEQHQLITDWERKIDNLAKLNEALTILANQRKEALEQEKFALLSLAKQKITNKKEAKELLASLEEKWKGEREELEQQLATKEEKEKELTEELTKKKALLVKQKLALSQLLAEKQKQLNHANL